MLTSSFQHSRDTHPLPVLQANGAGSRRGLRHRLQGHGGQPGPAGRAGGHPGLHRETQARLEPCGGKGPRVTQQRLDCLYRCSVPVLNPVLSIKYFNDFSRGREQVGVIQP